MNYVTINLFSSQVKFTFTFDSKTYFSNNYNIIVKFGFFGCLCKLVWMSESCVIFGCHSMIIMLLYIFVYYIFSFLVYSPDMPTSIPPQELLQGLGKNIFRALRFWLHYTLVVLAWLGVVPLTACKYFLSVCKWFNST